MPDTDDDSPFVSPRLPRLESAAPPAMDLRDVFAMEAFKLLLAAVWDGPIRSPQNPDAIAKDVWLLADAMMAERERRRNNED